MITLTVNFLQRIESILTLVIALNQDERKEQFEYQFIIIDVALHIVMPYKIILLKKMLSVFHSPLFI